MSDTNRTDWKSMISTAADALESAKAALDMAQTPELRRYALERCAALEREYRQLLHQHSHAEWTAKIPTTLQNADPTQDFSATPTFSPELKAVLDRYKARHDKAYTAAVTTFREIQPEGNHDSRDFADMLGVDPDWDDEYTEAYARSYVQDYFKDNHGRTRALDEFYDLLDSVDPLALDFSCLQGTDTGIRSGEDHLTPSERDFMKLVSLFRPNQTYGTKDRENPGYMAARYPTPQAQTRVELAQDTLVTCGFNTYLATVVLPRNGYDQAFKPTPKMDLGMSYNTMAPAIARQMYHQHMATLNDVQVDRSLKFKIPDSFGGELFRLLNPEDGNLNLNLYSSAILAPIHSSSAAKRYMKETGTTMEDMYFIDGKSLRQIADEKRPRPSDVDLRNQLLSALLSGEHRVEAATIQLDSRGAYTVQVSAIQPDLHCMDKPAKESRSAVRRLFDFGLTKIETPASKSEKLWANDPDREARQKAIRESMTARIMEEANYKLQDKLHSEENRKTFEKLNEKAKTPFAEELADLVAEKGNADQAVRDVTDRNHALEVRIGQIQQEQQRVDAFRKACRRHDMLTQRIDTLRGVTDDATDIGLQNLDSVLNSLPVEMANFNVNAIQRIVNTQAKPAFRRLEFACELTEMDPAQREAYMKDNSVAAGFSAEEINVLCGSDAEKREALMEQLREDYRTPLRTLIDRLGTALMDMPIAKSDFLEEDEKRSAEIASLRAQLEPVTKEMRFRQIEAEAAILDGRVLYGDDITRDDMYTGDLEGFVPPQTREEALERIAEIDERNALYQRHYEDRLKVQVGKELFLTGFDREQPTRKIQQDIRDTIEYMDSLQLPIDQMTADMQTAYKDITKELQEITELPSSTTLPDKVDDLTNSLFRICQLAIDSKPEYASLDTGSSQEVTRYNKDMHTRQWLMRNLRDFGTEERLEAMAQARGLTYPHEPERAEIGLEQLDSHRAPAQRPRANSMTHDEPARERPRSNSF